MTDNLDGSVPEENDLEESGFDEWLRDTDPPGELSVPQSVWDAAVETAFDPSHELTTDLTAAPGPDPSDSEPEPAVGGVEDPLSDDVTGDLLASGVEDDVFGGSAEPLDDPFEDGTLDDDF
ncbi:hypothetical protein [Gordonia sp. NPDC058843]|uniref:hypothetical protein n=1 Tax=Gordonia sp. NPDC058843 TaxID=3346648 RepID=UPI00368D564A